MALTRRGFVRRFGRVTAGTVTGAMLAARGFEDLVAAHAAGQDRPEIPPGMIRRVMLHVGTSTIRIQNGRISRLLSSNTVMRPPCETG